MIYKDLIRTGLLFSPYKNIEMSRPYLDKYGRIVNPNGLGFCDRCQKFVGLENDPCIDLFKNELEIVEVYIGDQLTFVYWRDKDKDKRKGLINLLYSPVNVLSMILRSDGLLGYQILLGKSENNVYNIYDTRSKEDITLAGDKIIDGVSSESADFGNKMFKRVIK